MTVFLTPSGGSDALDLEIESVSNLLRDLRHLREHRMPTDALLSGAPVLKGWCSAMRPVPCLRGRSVGHPVVLDGRDAVTSPLRVVSLDLGFVRTESRFWLLGAPATERFDA